MYFAWYIVIAKLYYLQLKKKIRRRIAQSIISVKFRKYNFISIVSTTKSRMYSIYMIFRTYVVIELYTTIVISSRPQRQGNYASDHNNRSAASISATQSVLKSSYAGTFMKYLHFLCNLFINQVLSWNKFRCK